jgi:hypothetical protein
MKRKFPYGIFFLLFLSTVCAAQTVVVTPKKVTYKRPKPAADFKKTFTINHPQVKAATPELSKKITDEISYEKVLGLNLKEEIDEIQWLDEADYEVNYNDKGVLVVTLSLMGSGAYPSMNDKTVVIDLKTGNRVFPADVFTNLETLAAKVGKAMQAEIEKTKVEYKNDPDAAGFDGSEYFDRAVYTSENLEAFSVGDKGVTFKYDYGFPHVVKAFQPEGRFFFGWAEMKPFIKPDGLLAIFVR